MVLLLMVYLILNRKVLDSIKIILFFNIFGKKPNLFEKSKNNRSV